MNTSRRKTVAFDSTALQALADQVETQEAGVCLTLPSRAEATTLRHMFYRWRKHYQELNDDITAYAAITARIEALPEEQEAVVLRFERGFTNQRLRELLTRGGVAIPDKPD